MNTYHFGQDVLDTYQSLSVGVQVLWLVVPPAFLAVMFALFLKYRLEVKTRDAGEARPFSPSHLQSHEIERLIVQRLSERHSGMPLMPVGKRNISYRGTGEGNQSLS